MKTKIIYISGGELFEMSQVRAAFDEVRNTLGLGKDTVLFGVPVDSDSALADTQSTHDIEPVATVAESEFKNEPVEPEIPAIIDEDSNEILDTETIEPIMTDDDADEIIDSVTDEIIDEIADDVIEDTSDVDTVIPILSVLGGGTATDAISAPQEVPAAVHIEQTDIVATPDETVSISDIHIDTEIIEPVAEDNTDVVSTTIGDMLNDDAPVSNAEKTLEQLLESMTPLREDHDTETDDNITGIYDSDEDATLAQLASEFAETEDKIVIETKTETSGKIGKLKNILPFKKAKREDSSLMGDLFGWAGIAANDDDFAMPGFFTTNNSRKQGA